MLSEIIFMEVVHLVEFIKKFIVNFLGISVVGCFLNFLFNNGTITLEMYKSPMFWAIGLLVCFIATYLDFRKKG